MKKSKKNILVLIPQFGQGGAEKVATMLAQMLHDSGRYNVCFCALYKIASMPAVKELEVSTLGIEPSSDIIGKLKNYYRTVLRLQRLKRELKVDLTISSLWPVDWMNALTGREKKIALIQINILHNPQNTAMVKARKLVTTIYRRFDKVVLGGNNLWDELTGFFKLDPEKLRVIHNAIDTELIDQNIAQPLSERLERLFAQNNMLVAANRLHDIKNTVALVRIYKGLSGTFNTKLLIIGEGDEKNNIEQKISEARLQFSNVEDANFNENADIFFLKFQQNIHNIISRAAVFLFPTKGEGLPLGLIEAMYSGIPVLASDCPNGGVFEIMRGKGSFHHPRTSPESTGGGYLMPIPVPEEPKTDQMWREKIGEFLKADKQALLTVSTANRNRAKDFSTNSINQQWHQLIEQMLHNS